MFLNLIICELKYLQAIWKSTLSCFGLCEVVDYFLVRVGLFDVVIIKINDSVAILECLSFDPIVENDFSLAILIQSCDFTILTYVLLHNFHISWISIVILFWKFHIIIFFLFFFFF